MLVWPYSVKILLNAAVQISSNASIKASWAWGAGEFHILRTNTLSLIYPHMEQAVFQTLLMCLSISSVLAYLDIGESGRSSLTLGGVLADAYNCQAWWIIFIPSLFFILCAVILLYLIKKWFEPVES
jgi:ABC-type dipeptide/oligopeptide/nickel transport system permease subunit